MICAETPPLDHLPEVGNANSLLASAIAIFYAVIQYLVTGKGTAPIFSSVLVILFVFIIVCLIAFYRKDDRLRA
jgi:membrane protein YdbS with pleckstrin-like domain